MVRRMGGRSCGTGIRVDEGTIAALRDRLQDVDDDIRLKAARGLEY